MNERISELLVESDNALTRNGKIYPHIGSRTLEDWEKFAELIVQECKDVLLNMINNQQGDFDSLDQALTEINEHFGVES